MRKFLLAICFVCLSGCSSGNAPRDAHDVTISTPRGDISFNVEYAKTDSERSLGLMNRTELAKDRGMLFFFEQPDFVSMWMKDMQISLDMIFIDEDKRIVEVLSNVPPCEAEDCPRYSTPRKVMYVLELAAGTARKQRISVGDTVMFE